MTAPNPTPINRILHLDNLAVCLHRGALHTPNHTPDDGLVYRTIHSVDIQAKRQTRRIPCGPGGVIHDYVSFYFGPRSPMLFQLHTGRVPGYADGQQPLVYLVSTAQIVESNRAGFVFSDGHGIASFTTWYDNLGQLDRIDWTTVYADYWADTVEDMDRQRRKQAEFLVHRVCPWELIEEIAVIDEAMKGRVQGVLNQFARTLHRPVTVRRSWYY